MRSDASSRAARYERRAPRAPRRGSRRRRGRSLTKYCANPPLLAALPPERGEELQPSEEALAQRVLAERLLHGALGAAAREDRSDVRLREEPEVDCDPADLRTLPRCQAIAATNADQGMRPGVDRGTRRGAGAVAGAGRGGVRRTRDVAASGPGRRDRPGRRARWRDAVGTRRVGPAPAAQAGQPPPRDSIRYASVTAWNSRASSASGRPRARARSGCVSSARRWYTSRSAALQLAVPGVNDRPEQEPPGAHQVLDRGLRSGLHRIGPRRDRACHPSFPASFRLAPEREPPPGRSRRAAPFQKEPAAKAARKPCRDRWLPAGRSTWIRRPG